MGLINGKKCVTDIDSSLKVALGGPGLFSRNQLEQQIECTHRVKMDKTDAYSF